MKEYQSLSHLRAFFRACFASMVMSGDVSSHVIPFSCRRRAEPIYSPVWIARIGIPTVAAR